MPRKLILAIILFHAMLSTSVQSTPLSDNAYAENIRQKIDIDYTVPDYSVKRPDILVMGWRLVKILQSLEKNYTQNIYNRYLSIILNHQTEECGPLYLQ